MYEPFPILEVFPQLERETLPMVHCSQTETDWTERVSNYQTASLAIQFQLCRFGL